MHNILQKIIDKTREEVARRKENVSLNVILNEVKDLDSSSRQGRTQNDISFESAMSAPNKEGLALIAEIKLASPTKGILGKKEDIIIRAKEYENAGVDAISIVTEAHFFKGDVSYIKKTKEHVSLPILQKDFIIDIYQIYEANQQGTDALLLIARLVNKKVLKHFVELCFAEGVEAIVEVNNEEDLEKALQTKTRIIAVNARDLDTFAVDVKKACKLLKSIPKKYIRLGFSGVSSRREKEQYEKAGANGILIGTVLMQTENIDKIIGGLR